MSEFHVNRMEQETKRAGKGEVVQIYYDLEVAFHKKEQRNWAQSGTVAKCVGRKEVTLCFSLCTRNPISFLHCHPGSIGETLRRSNQARSQHNQLPLTQSKCVHMFPKEEGMFLSTSEMPGERSSRECCRLRGAGDSDRVVFQLKPFH